MSFPGKGTHWKANLVVLIFLAACTSERPAITASVVVSEITPAQTAQGTPSSTMEGTASPAVPENCARGNHFDELESAGKYVNICYMSLLRMTRKNPRHWCSSFTARGLAPSALWTTADFPP